ncbi:MAG: hypothetical protein GF388_08435 [Candidatus Aegiribacteria sp.]|nr:hypothetical protein [Candidatus Aegiribacteria sp.]
MNRISPGFKRLAALYILELAAILSWTVLMDTIFNFFSGSWTILLPLAYLLSVTILAWLERAETRAHNSPLEACGLAEIGVDGSRPSQWQTFRRVLFTPPLLLALGIGMIPLPVTGKTLMQIITGTRIVPVDISMDPRSDSEILSQRRKALMKVISFSMVSLMVSAFIVLVPPELHTKETQNRLSSVHGLPEEERELMASYLEMKALYPDCLEYHVRLASLFYRNDMEEDLALELQQIERLDPNHSMLILRQDLSVTMEDILVAGDSSRTDTSSITSSIIEETEPTVQEDEDSQQDVPSDSVSLDLRLVASDSGSTDRDSTEADTDSLGSVSVDSSTDISVTDSLDNEETPPADSAGIPEADPPETEILDEPADQDSTAAEEQTPADETAEENAEQEVPPETEGP